MSSDMGEALHVVACSRLCKFVKMNCALLKLLIFQCEIKITVLFRLFLDTDRVKEH